MPHLAAVLLLAAVMAVVGCERLRPAGSVSGGAEMPDQEATDFELTETDAGAPLWRLNAVSASTFTSRNLVIVKTVRVEFFDQDGKVSSVLTARQGEINDRTRDMIARGNVVLQTAEGTRLSSEELQFSNDDQKIRVPETQLVRIVRGHDVLTGYGFESDVDLTQYEFKRRVEANVRSTGGKLDEER
jgi:LPS export ABC transporter protein LptC